MVRLTAAQRKALPKSSFAVPAKAATAKGKAAPGSFPVPDKAHARAALRLLHNAPASQQPAIRAKANAKLGKSNTAQAKSASRPSTARTTKPTARRSK